MRNFKRLLARLLVAPLAAALLGSTTAWAALSFSDAVESVAKEEDDEMYGLAEGRLSETKGLGDNSVTALDGDSSLEVHTDETKQSVETGGIVNVYGDKNNIYFYEPSSRTQEEIQTSSTEAPDYVVVNGEKYWRSIESNAPSQGSETGNEKADQPDPEVAKTETKRSIGTRIETPETSYSKEFFLISGYATLFCSALYPVGAVVSWVARRCADPSENKSRVSETEVDPAKKAEMDKAREYELVEERRLVLGLAVFGLVALCLGYVIP